jgi:LPS sulfotransferase NodH
MPITGEKPIFIVSAPRSGSTLMRLILDSHPRIGIPSPAWLYEMVRPYLYSYGDLSIRENLLALAEDILAAPSIKDWTSKLGAEEMVKAAKEASFAGLYDVLHRKYADDTGKARWGEKTPRNCFWMEEILDDYPDAQFVHIIRDGRDMAIDIADSRLWPYSLYSGMHMWEMFVSAARETGGKLGKDVYYEFQYEKLCADPEGELAKVCDFLGEDFSPQMLSHHQSTSAKSWGGGDPLHAKVLKPITTDYCEMYKTRLSDGDREALEAVAGDLLKDLGYPAADRPTPISGRLARQMLESDTPSNPSYVPYKGWHAKRRQERKERGVWRDQDRHSQLWGTL